MNNFLRLYKTARGGFVTRRPCRRGQTRREQRKVQGIY